MRWQLLPSAPPQQGSHCSLKCQAHSGSETAPSRAAPHPERQAGVLGERSNSAWMLTLKLNTVTKLPSAWLQFRSTITH